MNDKQIEGCAKRLPKLERDEFLRLHAEARALIEQGWALRRQAWAIYRPFQQPRKQR